MKKKKREDKALTVTIKDTNLEVWQKLKDMKAAIIADNKETAQKRKKNRRPWKGGGYSK